MINNIMRISIIGPIGIQGPLINKPAGPVDIGGSTNDLVSLIRPIWLFINYIPTYFSYDG